eukprot:15346492-Ditylum_brightwellii.AAC.2
MVLGDKALQHWRQLKSEATGLTILEVEDREGKDQTEAGGDGGKYYKKELAGTKVRHRGVQCSKSYGTISQAITMQHIHKNTTSETIYRSPYNWKHGIYFPDYKKSTLCSYTFPQPQTPSYLKKS